MNPNTCFIEGKNDIPQLPSNHYIYTRVYMCPSCNKVKISFKLKAMVLCNPAPALFLTIKWNSYHCFQLSAIF